MRGISLLGEEEVACKAGIFCMELVSKLVSPGILRKTTKLVSILSVGVQTEIRNG
jgi:hypothetical protein